MRRSGGAAASGNPCMSDSEKEANEEGTGTPQVGASLRVDPRTLSSEEQEFARMMGFADEGETDAPVAATTKPTPKPQPRPAEGEASDLALPPPLVSPAEIESPIAEAVADTVAGAVAAAPESPAPAPRDWEEIHPRAATLGRQSALIERADRVMKLEPTMAPPPPKSKDSSAPATMIPAPDVAALRTTLSERETRIAELESRVRELSVALEARSRTIATTAAASTSVLPVQAEIEKQKDALALEVDALLQERDRLGDALATASSARADLQHRVERLETALRAARGASGPLPDGERDLRAEVVGLRRRLEESGDEGRRLRETVDVQATELAIAAAHRDDREHENVQLRERIATFERDRAVQLERLDDALARQRELLALVSRVQAENVELRSTQAALEETLEARDLEISAREEHLLVTRRGLALRDEQLIDASERLEQERHRHELLETELDRARLAQTEMEERLLRREARIASLSTTLARIEEAIGRTLPPARAEAAIRVESPVVAAASLDGSDPIDSMPKVHATPIEAMPETLLDAPASVPPVLSPTTALPALFASWRNEKLSALSNEATTIDAFLARRLVERAGDASAAPLRITSLAGARPEAEVELARAWTALGGGEIAIQVLESSAASTALRREAIEAAGLTDSISISLWEAVDRPSQPEADALLLSDALCGQADPEAILDELLRGLRPDGLVLFADRIGGGPLELSETTLEKLGELWQVLPEAWTEQPALAVAPIAGDDGGAPAAATDLVSALFDRLEPVTTVGLGHVVDLAVGPARGFALSEPGVAAEAFLTSIDAIDESRSILESLPPRHGIAVFGCRNGRSERDATGGEVLGLAWMRSRR